MLHSERQICVLERDERVLIFQHGNIERELTASQLHGGPLSFITIAQLLQQTLLYQTLLRYGAGSAAGSDVVGKLCTIE